jgi:large subunit ribosomal protein L35
VVLSDIESDRFELHRGLLLQMMRRSATTRPKMTMVSGMTVRIRTEPKTSGFSAVAPTAAVPMAYSARAVAKAVVLMAMEAYRPVETDDWPGVRSHRCETILHGETTTAVLAFSETLYTQQFATITRELAKCVTKLTDLADSLKEWQAGKCQGSRPTEKSVAKRFKITARGKVLRPRAGRRHLLQTKNAKRRRGLRGSHLVDPTDEYRIKQNLLFDH